MPSSAPIAGRAVRAGVLTDRAGAYTVLVTSTGAGWSSAGSIALTGGTTPAPGGLNGLRVFVRDRESGAYWSLGAAVAPCALTWQPGRLTLTQQHLDLACDLTVVVDPEATRECRRLRLTNHGSTPRSLDVTTCAEVVLNQPAAHASHPVFSKLFLQTDVHDGVLLVRRRGRDPRDHHPWLAHACLGGAEPSWETDRVHFVGRGRDWRAPEALLRAGPLPGTTGNVLDPVVALRRRFTLAAGETATLDIVLAAAPERSGALAMVRDVDVNALLARARASADPTPPAADVVLPAAMPPTRRLEVLATVGTLTADATPGAPRLPDAAVTLPARTPLRFFNGYGGFREDGRQYVIPVTTAADGRLRVPPQPWVNVIANERVGCIVSEVGLGVTWCTNSRENRLTRWSNDPLLDPPSETLVLTDAATGRMVSAFARPCPGGGHYEVAHGFGYTRCRYADDDLGIDTLVFVDRERPVRLVRLRVEARGGASRRLALRTDCPLDVSDPGAVTIWTDPESGATFAQNHGAGAFADHVAFAAVVAGAHAEIRPAGGVADAPRFTHDVAVTLDAGQTAEVVLLLGQGEDAAEAARLVRELMTLTACDDAWRQARDFWREGLAGLHVQTPDAALDILLGGWLAYQTLSCRIRGRSAFYQSGGAYGFRDQLQDATALAVLWPEVARAQILRNAAHQFVEGDVLHWWHPPRSQGIRTRFADDLVWLPHLLPHYLETTGDEAILDEVVPYLTARPLAPGEDEVYLEPTVAAETGTIYDHCCRALDRALTRGSHGLPLFGTGDWNDGMNRVGREGSGESVWMGFFLAATLDAFIPLCEARQDDDRAARYRAYRRDVAAALEAEAWDGDWYLRGFYDDGTPLGSHRDQECRIDALVQAWSALSGAAAPARAVRAMDAVERHLISDEERLIRLLTPPFVDTPHDPGYIKGYVAGVRENGGQYTHAALWVVRAVAALGRRDRAAALLNLLNPIRHALTEADVQRYQVEPYVVAADVYGAAPHVGRGGWTWYTGSSGWMLRVALESILGLQVRGGRALVLAPCVPDDWPGYAIDWREPGSRTPYRIEVTNPDGCSEVVVAATVDGHAVAPLDGVLQMPLVRDGRPHRVMVTLGARRGA